MLNAQYIGVFTIIALILGWISSKLVVLVPRHLLTAYYTECKAALKDPVAPPSAHRYLLPILFATALYAVFMPLHVYGINILGISAILLAMLLIILGAIDMQTKLLPDWLVYTGLWAGLLLNTQHLWTTPQTAILGAILGYSIPWALLRSSVFLQKKKCLAMETVN